MHKHKDRLHVDGECLERQNAMFYDKDETVKAVHSINMAKEAIEDDHNHISLVKFQFPHPDVEFAKVLEVVGTVDVDDIKEKMKKDKLEQLMKTT